MGDSQKTCSVCQKSFVVKYRRQIVRKGGKVNYYCSTECIERANTTGPQKHLCSVCNQPFDLNYVYQQVQLGDTTYLFCSMECRKTITEAYEAKRKETQKVPLRVAVLNQKGGTGKTTSCVSISAGLADAGYKVLVLDVDAQGHVGLSLGIEPKSRKTIHHIIFEDAELSDVVVRARPNLDLVVGNTTLASCEISLARLNSGRETLLREKLSDERGYDFIIMDCGPSLSLINTNALTFADHLLIPVSCDFLSLVGVQQVMQTLKKVNQVLIHPIEIMGVLPTFYDMRNSIGEESVRSLKSHFGDKVLPPIRVYSKIKEAPKEGKTIFEHDPNSRGAHDYRSVVDFFVSFKNAKDA